MKIKKQKNGFCLIELVFTILLIGILIAISVGSIKVFKSKAHEKVIASNVRVMEYNLEVENADTNSFHKILDGDFAKMIKLGNKSKKNSHVYNRSGMVYSQHTDELDSSYSLIPKRFRDQINKDLNGDFILNNFTNKVYYVDNALIKKENKKNEEGELPEEIINPYTLDGLTFTWKATGDEKIYGNPIKFNTEISETYHGHNEKTLRIIHKNDYGSEYYNRITKDTKALNEIDEIKDKYIMVEGHYKSSGGVGKYKNKAGQMLMYEWGQILPINDVEYLFFGYGNFTTQGGTITNVKILNSNNPLDLYNPNGATEEAKDIPEVSLFI